MQLEDDFLDNDLGGECCITICEHDQVNGCDKCYVVEEMTPFQQALSIFLFPLRFLSNLASLILVILGVLLMRAPSIFLSIFIVSLVISGFYHLLYFLIFYWMS
jgi:hypothetical protein